MAICTSCPNCRQQQTVTIAQLRECRAITWCQSCQIHFDALESLDETQRLPLLNHSTAADETLPWEAPPGIANPLWQRGFWLGMAVAVGQILYFQLPHWLQYPTFRRPLVSVCQTLGCQLPDYRNLAEWTVMDSHWDEMPGGGRLLVGLVSNQAEFAQPYPGLQVTLLDFQGQALGSRTFRANHYAPNHETRPVAPGNPFAFTLPLAAPPMPIAGYHLDLVD